MAHCDLCVAAFAAALRVRPSVCWPRTCAHVSRNLLFGRSRVTSWVDVAKSQISRCRKWSLCCVLYHTCLQPCMLCEFPCVPLIWLICIVSAWCAGEDAAGGPLRRVHRRQGHHLGPPHAARHAQAVRRRHLRLRRWVDPSATQLQWSFGYLGMCSMASPNTTSMVFWKYTFGYAIETYAREDKCNNTSALPG